MNWRRRRWRRRKATKPCGWTMHLLPFEAVQLGLDFGKLPLALGQLQIAHPFVPHVASAKLQVGRNILVVPWAKDATTHLRSQCSLIGCHLETAEQLHVVPAPIRHVVQHHSSHCRSSSKFCSRWHGYRLGGRSHGLHRNIWSWIACKELKATNVNTNNPKAPSLTRLLFVYLNLNESPEAGENQSSKSKAKHLSIGPCGLYILHQVQHEGAAVPEPSFCRHLHELSVQICIRLDATLHIRAHLGLRSCSSISWLCTCTWPSGGLWQHLQPVYRIHGCHGWDASSMSCFWISNAHGHVSLARPYIWIYIYL